MSAFAYISIIEALGKLIIAFLIIISPVDKLIFYSILMCLMALLVRFIYGFYCKKHFEECSYNFVWDRMLLKEMFSFAGWNFIGSVAGILRTQGIGVLLNIYFGPIVNAAQGIAIQVNNAINSFSSNFLTAINPQIIKSYSQKDLNRAFDLTMRASRFAFLLLLILSIPLILETRYVLNLWLKTIPEYSITFIQLTLILTIIESISLPLITLQQATGKVKNYQIVVGSMHMLNFPISFILLHIGLQPDIVYIVAIILACITFYARIYMLKRIINISIAIFLKEVLLRLIYVIILVVIITFTLKQLNLSAIINIITSILSTTCITLIIGLKKEEFRYVTSKILKKR